MAISVWVVPGSSRSVIDGRYGDRVKIRVTSPRQGGKAGAEVVRILTDLMGTTVTMQSGMRSRSKVFEVSTTDMDMVRRKLGL